MVYLGKNFKISSIIPVTSTDIDVPDNIIVINGNDLQSRAEAFDLISDEKAPNTVIMLGTRDDKIEQCLSNLFAKPNSRETTLTYNAITGAQAVSIRGGSYNPAPLDSLNTPDQDVYDLWQNTFIGTDTDMGEEAGRITLLNSRLLIWNSYSNNNAKIHIDPIFSEHDFRMIDCVSGTGTLFFDNNDFEIHGQKVFQTARITNAWAAPEHTTILMREPSQDSPDASPSIHAHGIQAGKAAPRVLIRSDYTLS